MVFIALSHIIILLEVLVGLVVIGKYVVAVVRALHTEVVVGGLRQGALAVGRLDDALRQGDGGRYAIPPHLFHGVFRIIVDIGLP